LQKERDKIPRVVSSITTRTNDPPGYIINWKNGFFINRSNGEINEERLLTFGPENWINEMRKT